MVFYVRIYIYIYGGSLLGKYSCALCFIIHMQNIRMCMFYFLQ